MDSSLGVMRVGGEKVCRLKDLCPYLTAFEVFPGADLDRDSAVSVVPTKFAVSPNFIAVLDSADAAANPIYPTKSDISSHIRTFVLLAYGLLNHWRTENPQA